MVETTTTGTSTTGIAAPCFNRLPCGICRLTMMRCPIMPITITPTWYGLTEITYEAKGKE